MEESCDGIHLNFMNASTQNPQSGLLLAIATVFSILATLAVNTLSNIRPPGGINVGEIANTILRGVLIVPANYAFAIWGLIYLGLIAYGVYQFQLPQRNTPVIRSANLWLILACLAQVAWIYLFTLRQFWWSVLAMLVILLSLIAAYVRLGVGQNPVHRSRRWMAHIPFSIYLAWISVATVVNIASALYASGWNGWGLSSTGWTMLMLVISTAIAATVTLRRHDIAFPLVFVWAEVAIALRHLDAPALWVTAGLGAIALVALVALRRLAPAAQ